MDKTKKRNSNEMNEDSGLKSMLYALLFLKWFSPSPDKQKKKIKKNYFLFDFIFF